MIPSDGSEASFEVNGPVHDMADRIDAAKCWPERDNHFFPGVSEVCQCGKYKSWKKACDDLRIR